MNYEIAKSNVFVKVISKDGYFGNEIELGLALIGNQLFGVHKSGCHLASSYKYDSQDEVIFRIKGKWGDLSRYRLTN